jgi:nitrate reductase assembly molybdenum cofactor insertion protein NarJ
MPTAHYDVLARLFAHPGPEFEADVTRAIVLHSEHYPCVAQRLGEFQRLLPKGDLVALQELHTRTFDVQAITSLDIGYTLFGEDYKRGALLANLSGEHTRAGNDCGAELGDHLTNVLRLLPKLTDAALREEFVRVLLAPALREMIREFEPARLAKKEELYKKHHKTIIEAAAGETRTVYRYALEAVVEVLREDFALKVSLPIAQESKFVGAVGTEMGIESCGGCASNARGTR